MHTLEEESHFSGFYGFSIFFWFWRVLFYYQRFLFYQLETDLVNSVTRFTVADCQTHLQERFAELSLSFLTISGESITVRCYTEDNGKKFSYSSYSLRDSH